VPGPEYVPPPPARARGSGTWKWIAIGCVGALALGIVLGAVAVGMCVKAARGAFTEDPDEVERIAGEMIDYRIPGGSRGLFAMDVIYRMAVVGSLDEPPSTVLAVISMPSGMTGMSEEELERQLESAMDRQGHNHSIQETEVRTESICGHEVDVHVQQGAVQTDQGERHVTTWQATFLHGDDMLLVQVTATGEGSDQVAGKVFRSISCK
jgi:hypothetical protein